MDVSKLAQKYGGGGHKKASGFRFKAAGKFPWKPIKKRMKKLIIYTDGGARGNPGPAAIGVVVGEKGYGEAIGNTTNNIAEYKAVIFGLKKPSHFWAGRRRRRPRLRCGRIPSLS